MTEETSEEKILQIVLDKIKESDNFNNRRFTSMMDNFRSQTKKIEGGNDLIRGDIGLLKGEHIDFRQDVESRLGFIEADSKKIRDSIKSNHVESIQKFNEVNQTLDEIKKLIQNRQNPTSES